MYKKALAEELKNFTGIDDPYEPPANPELTIDAESETHGQSAPRILAWLEQAGLAEQAPQPDYPPEVAEQIRARLIALSHIER